ncbi:hypothetical protein [Tsukamurella soli]|uniref:hypothetical protein n=1 Tax=Tsukamurella soli TaxID=644556 RepID=UPI0031F1721C
MATFGVIILSGCSHTDPAQSAATSSVTDSLESGTTLPFQPVPSFPPFPGPYHSIRAVIAKGGTTPIHSTDPDAPAAAVRDFDSRSPECSGPAKNYTTNSGTFTVLCDPDHVPYLLGEVVVAGSDILSVQIRHLENESRDVTIVRIRDSAFKGEARYVAAHLGGEIAVARDGVVCTSQVLTSPLNSPEGEFSGGTETARCFD